jgi:transcriptional regulator of acetoin/glycerol metabolism
MTPTSLHLASGEGPRARGSSRSPDTGASAHARVLEALRAADGSVTEASARLGVHRTTLWRWMRGLGLRREDYRA